MSQRALALLSFAVCCRISKGQNDAIYNHKNTFTASYKLEAAATEGLTDREKYLSVLLGQDGVYTIVRGTDNKDKIAEAGYSKASLNQTGWNQLSVKVDASIGPEKHMQGLFAAGLLEGYMTCRDIVKYSFNAKYAMFNVRYPSDGLIQFYRDNLAWVDGQINEKGDQDPYWYNIAAVLAQFDGLVKGYAMSPCYDRFPFNGLEFYLLNSYGDNYDLQERYPSVISKPDDLSWALTQSYIRTTAPALRFRPNVGNMAAGDEEPVDYAALEAASLEARHRPAVGGDDRCSALVKLVGDNKDVLICHTTFDHYSAMWPRVMKGYSLPVWDGHDMTQQDITFSSAPGQLASLDDIYVLKGKGKQMVVVETTLDLNDPTLAWNFTPESLLYWMRVTATNALAYDGKTWCETFRIANSGTYNNEWMVVDFNKFKAGEKPAPGFFYILNQTPRYVGIRDGTSALVNSTYFASYNIPSDPQAYRVMGYERLLVEDGDIGSYEQSPRARLFKQLQGSIKNVEDMERVCQYNNYLKNDLSQGHPAFSIAARADLEHNLTSWLFSAYGAIDGKVVSYIDAFQSPDGATPIHARLGPTSDDVEHFCWGSKSSFGSIIKTGHPDCYKFVWDKLQPLDLTAIPHAAVEIVGNGNGFERLRLSNLRSSPQKSGSTTAALREGKFKFNR